jgi:hypothetical protein
MVVVIGFVLVTAFNENKKRKAVLEKLSGLLKGSISRNVFVSRFHGEYQGLKLSIELIPRAKNTPSYLKIALMKDSSFKLTVYKESSLSRFGHRLGLLREVKTGDGDFDEEFLIFSNNQPSAMNYFSSPAVKEAVRELFGDNFSAIFVGRKRVLIQKEDYVLQRDLEPQNVMLVLEQLGIIAQRLF